MLFPSWTIADVNSLRSRLQKVTLLNLFFENTWTSGEIWGFGPKWRKLILKTNVWIVSHWASAANRFGRFARKNERNRDNHIFRYLLMSSACLKMKLLWLKSISFIQVYRYCNSKGPKAEPCGIPKINGLGAKNLAKNWDNHPSFNNVTLSTWINFLWHQLSQA